ncbi:unnamed protein product [Chironomus riparius]|uniref:Uncharacterized protein n=1 Tax=Chironomus riparius TaxID=315576 RepID=A0A9N9RZF2_9DIPT|nr:unnamed protein product [Chironomus riparius]
MHNLFLKIFFYSLIFFLISKMLFVVFTICQELCVSSTIALSVSLKLITSYKFFRTSNFLHNKTYFYVAELNIFGCSEFINGGLFMDDVKYNIPSSIMISSSLFDILRAIISQLPIASKLAIDSW